ncbi:MAG: DUF934 domain-containing protein [Proteobacteria bacterium]|nr:DUF934 domain-containing protein [Pseudomonadota bacterium]
MPALINTSGDEIIDETPLVPVEEWTEGTNQGIVLAVDTEPNEALAKAAVIAIDFPAFTDGRGLSLAVLLRDRYGFKGDLRAIGDVQPDMLHYLVRCGFSSFLLPDGRRMDTAKSAFAPYTNHYQVSTTYATGHD